jgi:hypothetical protein
MAERAVNKVAEAIVICSSPDVCKTPMGPNLVPVPYPIIAKFDSSQVTAGQTNFEGNAVFHMGSHLPNVQGDEAGVGGGVISGVNMGCCKPIEHSSTVRVEGQWIVRHGDMMDMNCAGPKGVGNTKGRILFLIAMKMARVNPDGSIEYKDTRQTTDANGNTTTEETTVTQSTDGQIQQAGSESTTTDASGKVTNKQETGFEFDQNGQLTDQKLDTSGTPPAATKPAPEPAASPAEIQAAEAEIAAAEAEIAALEEEQRLDAAQAALDVVGLLDPTPLSDLTSSGISLARGDWLGAGLGIISAVPYLGDALAKPAKAAKASAKAVALAKKLQKARDTLASAKKKLEALRKGKKAKPDAPPAKADNGGKIKGRPKKMKEHKPKCFKPGEKLKKNWKGDPKKLEKEFYDQLKGQEAGLNELSVGKYLEHRKQFEELGRGTGAAQAAARKELTDKITASVENSLNNRGVVGANAKSQAAAKAKEIMGGLAALHEPDMIAGGADHVVRHGNTEVNSSLGSQWSKSGRVADLDKEAEKALKELGPDAKMNVKLERCPPGK